METNSYKIFQYEIFSNFLHFLIVRNKVSNKYKTACNIAEAYPIVCLQRNGTIKFWTEFSFFIPGPICFSV